jgi:hypothetical protein
LERVINADSSNNLPIIGPSTGPHPNWLGLDGIPPAYSTFNKDQTFVESLTSLARDGYPGSS